MIWADEFCIIGNNVLIIQMYLYEFGNGIRLQVLFLPPLKLNLSVYSGSYVKFTYGPFFCRAFTVLRCYDPTKRLFCRW